MDMVYTWFLRGISLEGSAGIVMATNIFRFYSYALGCLWWNLDHMVGREMELIHRLRCHARYGTGKPIFLSKLEYIP